MFYWCIDELLHAGKCHYFIEFLADLAPFHPEDGPVEIHVFTSGQFGMKSCPHLKKRGHTAVNFNSSVGRFRDSRERFEQRTFPRAVSADDPEYFALFHFKRHIL